MRGQVGFPVERMGLEGGGGGGNGKCEVCLIQIYLPAGSLPPLTCCWIVPLPYWAACLVNQAVGQLALPDMLSDSLPCQSSSWAACRVNLAVGAAGPVNCAVGQLAQSTMLLGQLALSTVLLGQRTLSTVLFSLPCLAVLLGQLAQSTSLCCWGSLPCCTGWWVCYQVNCLLAFATDSSGWPAWQLALECCWTVPVCLRHLAFEHDVRQLTLPHLLLGSLPDQKP